MKINRFFLGIALCVLISSGCTRKNSQVDSPLACLVNSEMINKSEEWKEIDKSQGNLSKVNQENEHPYNQFYSLVTGLYGKEKNFIKVNNTIDLYTVIIDWKEGLILDGMKNKALLSSNLISIGKTNEYTCAEETNKSSYTSFGCAYKATYSNVIVNLYIWGPSEMNIEDIEKLINTLLTEIDVCIMTLF